MSNDMAQLFAHLDQIENLARRYREISGEDTYIPAIDVPEEMEHLREIVNAQKFIPWPSHLRHGKGPKVSLKQTEVEKKRASFVAVEGGKSKAPAASTIFTTRTVHQAVRTIRDLGLETAMSQVATLQECFGGEITRQAFQMILEDLSNKR